MFESSLVIVIDRLGEILVLSETCHNLVILQKAGTEGYVRMSGTEGYVRMSGTVNVPFLCCCCSIMFLQHCLFCLEVTFYL